MGDTGVIQTSTGLSLCMVYNPEGSVLSSKSSAVTLICRICAHFVQSPHPVAFVYPPTGCTNDTVLNITNGADLQGKIAVFQRGVCNFSLKMQGASQNGAVAIIIVNYPGQDVVSSPPDCVSATASYGHAAVLIRIICMCAGLLLR